MLPGKSYCKAVEYCLPNSENPMLICKNCCESRNLSPLTHKGIEIADDILYNQLL